MDPVVMAAGSFERGGIGALSASGLDSSLATVPGTAANPGLRQKVSKLFEFLKAYIDLRYPPVRDIEEQPGVLWLDDLPAHADIDVRYDEDGSENDASEEREVVVTITRPTTTECPRPPAGLTGWLKPGWRDINGEVEVQQTRNTVDADGRTVIEAFTEDYGRSLLLDAWRKQREQWVANEKPARGALGIFQTVYEWYGSIEREGERIELLVGDGVIRCPHADGDFNHPVLLQKLELEFYPEKQRPQFVFR